MIELYHVSPSRSVRVLWTLEECKAPYRIHTVEVPVREKQRTYLDINPAGLFPSAIDDGAVLTESLSICDHVARKYGNDALVRNPDQGEYRRYMQFLLFGEATLGVTLANLMRYGPQQPTEVQAPHVVEDGIAAYAARLDMLERTLGDGPYILGQGFSLADVSVGYTLWLSRAFFAMGDMLGPKTSAYLDQLLTRPALQKAIAG